jgi:hypothetical protein
VVVGHKILGECGRDNDHVYAHVDQSNDLMRGTLLQMSRGGGEQLVEISGRQGDANLLFASFLSVACDYQGLAVVQVLA